jgi:hypothetical protein
MPNYIGKRRLLKLADMLEADAKNKKGIKFDIGTVGYTCDETTKPTLSCGTTACAMGLAAISGKFKRAGLSYSFQENNPEGVHISTTMYGTEVSYIDAAIQLFDISFLEAGLLFSPGHYPDDKSEGAKGEREVAKRIRRLVAGKPIVKEEECIFI